MGAKRAQKAAKKPQVKSPEVKRDAGGRIQKGASGNPGGQPKWVRELRDLLQEDAHAARKLLRDVIDGDEQDMQHRIQAATTVLRYTVPTPKVSVDVTSGDRPLENVPTEVLEAFLRKR